MLPKVHKFILNYIQVLSAREIYEPLYPHDTHSWKERTFLSLWEREGCSFLDRAALTNLIVVGDASYEMEAGISF